ncbi:thyrotropin-releasing hormone receptor-like [Amphiura filiformis]|uniref:thyrotropin-releasing hormone receptor-like n=1 Tax=Amphiura filiformis TaxID=82378 RepID=UPI003B22044F
MSSVELMLFMQESNFTFLPNSDFCGPVLVNISEIAEELLYNHIQIFFVTVILPIILAFGLLGNVWFLFVICRLRWMRTPLNCYLINLAIADIFFLLFAGGEKLFQKMTSPVTNNAATMGTVGCVLIPVVTDCCYFASIFIVTLVSLKRFYAICRPLQQKRHGARHKSLRMVLIAWFGALAFSCLLIPGECVLTTYCVEWPATDYYKHFPTVIGYCIAMEPWLADLRNSVQTVPFFVAMILNAIFYGNIIMAVHSSATWSGGSSQSGGENRARNLRNRHRVSRMLVINGVLFFLCLAPFEITTFASMITGDNFEGSTMAKTWKEICYTLMYLNSAINPVIYNVAHPRYRHAFRLAFAGNWPWGKSQATTTSSLKRSRQLTPQRLNQELINPPEQLECYSAVKEEIE